MIPIPFAGTDNLKSTVKASVFLYLSKFLIIFRSALQYSMTVSSDLQTCCCEVQFHSCHAHIVADLFEISLDSFTMISNELPIVTFIFFDYRDVNYLIFPHKLELPFLTELMNPYKSLQEEYSKAFCLELSMLRITCNDNPLRYQKKLILHKHLICRKKYIYFSWLFMRVTGFSRV